MHVPVHFQLLLDSKELSQSDVHVHFPAGAVGKDGPSAGVTITTVLVSLFSKQCVRSDTAMTGEITLRGIVLPVSAHMGSAMRKRVFGHMQTAKPQISLYSHTV